MSSPTDDSARDAETRRSRREWFRPPTQDGPSGTFQVLTVCTGNICRSPLAEQLIREGLAGLPLEIRSAGTMARDGMQMPAEAQLLARQLGVPTAEAAAHRSSPLRERDLGSPGLILGMARDHRRRVVEIAPAKLRVAFTVREFARLARAVDDASVRQAADAAGTDVSARLRSAILTVATRRGRVAPPEHVDDDDVVDPYRGPWEDYELAGAQLAPAVAEVVRVLRIAATV